MHLLVLVGSLRAASLNRQLANAVISELPEDVDATLYEGLADVPHFSEDLEDEVPAAAQRLRQAIKEADAVLLVTPEYNGSTPGVLKNAIDWGSRPRDDAALAGKPAAVMGATPSPGATKGAREVVVRALKVAGAAPLDDTFGIAKAHESFADGRPAEADLRKAVELVDGLRASIGQAAPVG